MADLPLGFDRADGNAGRVGTPSPFGAVQADSNGLTGNVADVVLNIEEATDSPTIERAEQGTVTHKFILSWEEAKVRIQFLGRGTVREDSFGNVFKVLSASIQYGVPAVEMATLTVVEESLSFDSPPDQFKIMPVELGINIIKHPRYYYAFLGDGPGSVTEAQNQMVIRMLQNYFENTSAAYRDSLTALMTASRGSDAGAGAAQPPAPTTFSKTSVVFEVGAKIAGSDMAKRAALEIIQKYWRGEETPYIVGYQIEWSSFYFRPPFLNPGGYVENPMTEAAPALPDYFWSPDYPPSSVTIFDALAAINPQSYSVDGTPGGDVAISWLRRADEYEYERTWMKITRGWYGTPVGHWDAELHAAFMRPQVPTDYLQIGA